MFTCRRLGKTVQVQTSVGMRVQKTDAAGRTWFVLASVLPAYQPDLLPLKLCQLAAGSGSMLLSYVPVRAAGGRPQRLLDVLVICSRLQDKIGVLWWYLQQFPGS